MTHYVSHSTPVQNADSPAAPAVDRKTMRRLLDDVGGDADSLAELLGVYLGDAPRLLQAMAQACVTSDGAALGMAAHTLKSTSASFGALPLSALCAELSRLTRSAATTQWSAQVARITAEFERGRAILQGPAGAPAEALDIGELLARIG